MFGKFRKKKILLIQQDLLMPCSKGHNLHKLFIEPLSKELEIDFMSYYL
jgi:hypothetical protein